MKTILFIVSCIYILFYHFFLNVTVSQTAAAQLSNDTVVYGLASAAASGGGVYSWVHTFCWFIVLYTVLVKVFKKLEKMLNEKDVI